MTDSKEVSRNRIKKLQEELSKTKKDNELIENLYKSISNGIENASSLDEFYDIPYTNLYNIISKVDFSTVENYIDVIKTIINKFYEKYNKGVGLLSVISCKSCIFTMRDIIEILKCFKNSDLLSKLWDSFNDNEELPVVDYEYEIERREKKIEELKEFGEDIDSPVTQPPPDFEPNIHKAAELGKLSSVKYLIGTGRASVFSQTNKKKRNTPLHFACLNGHLNVIKYLIKQGARITISNKDGVTPLENVVSKGYMHVIQYLFDDKIIDKTQGIAMYLLLYACQYGHNDLAKYLIEKQNYDTNFCDGKSRSALHFSCMVLRSNKDAIISYLVNKNPKLVNCQDIMGNTPLHYACEKNNEEAVEILLNVPEINVNLQNNEGNTPLHIISKNCKTIYSFNAHNIARNLVKYGANKTIVNRWNQTPDDIDDISGSDSIIHRMYTGYRPPLTSTDFYIGYAT